jgi:hypothetical protein
VIFNTPSGYTLAAPMTLFIEPTFMGDEPPTPSEIVPYVSTFIVDWFLLCLGIQICILILV